jgi:hypothetical protein
VDRLLAKLQKWLADAGAPHRARTPSRDYSEEVVKVRGLLEGLKWERWNSASDEFEWEGSSVSADSLSHHCSATIFAFALLVDLADSEGRR